MIPKIIEYTDGRINILPETFMIKELNDIINKHGDGSQTGNGAEPYLAYVYLMTSPDSPYINLPQEDVSDAIKFDITQSIGDFEEDDELIQPAIRRIASMYETRQKRYYDALGIIMDKVVQHAREMEVSSAGKDQNLDTFNKMLREAGSTFKSYREVEKIIDEELKAKMKGKATLGEY